MNKAQLDQAKMMLTTLPTTWQLGVKRAIRLLVFMLLILFWTGVAVGHYLWT